MSSIFEDNARIEIECPGCHRKFGRSLRSLRRERNFMCPRCGDVEFNSSQFSRELDKIEREMRRIFQ